MIKKLLSLLMCFILIFSLTSCKTDIKVDNKSEKVKSTYIVDTSDLDAIDNKYVVDIFNSRIGIGNSWDNVNNIDPTELFLFYVFKDFKTIKSTEKIIDINSNRYYYEIDTVYEGLKNYFGDFDKENLRKSDYYDRETKMIYNDGVGSVAGIDYSIKNIKQTDDILEIDYNIDDSRDQKDTEPPIHLSGTLKVKIIDENNFKYLSCHVEDNMSNFNYSEIEKLPEMTTENQSYYDKYIKLFKGHINPFHQDFSENNFEYFDAGFMYPYLAVNDNKDSIEKLKSCKKLPQDTVENTVLKYFPMTKEYCREVTGLHMFGYHEDEKYYDIAPLHLDKSINKCIINKSETENNILKLHCDWYTTDHKSLKDVYSYWGASILSIKLTDDGSWKYISNKVIKQENNKNKPHNK